MTGRNVNRRDREIMESRHTTFERGTQNRSENSYSKEQGKRKRLETINFTKAETSSYELNPNNGVALYNPMKTSEKEKFDHAIAEAAKKATENANNSAKTEIMSFYSALFQIPEITETAREKIRQCCKQHLKLNNFLI